MKTINILDSEPSRDDHADTLMKGRNTENCCFRQCSKYLCAATGVFGGLFLILGILSLTLGNGILVGMVEKNLPIDKNSHGFDDWLNPPVEISTSVFVWNVTNAEYVENGEKPKLEEIGPFVYKIKMIKESMDFKTNRSKLKFGENNEETTVGMT